MNATAVVYGQNIGRSLMILVYAIAAVVTRLRVESSVEICKCTSEAASRFDSLGRAAFAKFPYPPLYLKNNTYLQLDNKSPSNSYFSDIPLGAL